MKKLIATIVVIMTMANSFAQDVIITKNSERIDCSVKEISDTEVKYKRQDNPNGPMFILSVSKISSISFANGESLQLDKDTHQNDTEHSLLQMDILANDESFPVTVSLNRVITYSPGKKLEYKDGNYYYDGDFLNDDETNEFLKQTCWEAKAKKDNGEISGALGGWWLGPSGVSLLLLGALQSETDKHNGTSHKGRIIGFVAGGTVLTTLGIICIADKYSSKRKTADIFNQKCGDKINKYPSELSLGFAPTGVCVTFSF